MSEVHLERNELPAARQHLRHGEELGEHLGLPQHRYRWRVAMARLLQAEGDLDGALDSLGEAERLYDGSDFFPYVRPIPALRARVLVARGDLGEALGCARDRGLSVDDDVSYLREFEHITLSRVLLARCTEEQAEGGLDDATDSWSASCPQRKLGAGPAASSRSGCCRRWPSTRGNRAAARTALERAVTVAEPEGYVRVFVDAGPPVVSLLTATAKQGTARTYVRRLLAASKQPRPRPRPRHLSDAGSDRAAERTRARGAPPARHRPGRPGHRPRARGVGEHRPDAHQEHLPQARGEQPSGGGPPGRGARPVVAEPQALNKSSGCPRPSALLPTRITTANHHTW